MTNIDYQYLESYLCLLVSNKKIASLERFKLAWLNASTRGLRAVINKHQLTRIQTRCRLLPPTMPPAIIWALRKGSGIAL
jgi:hypothetical protein